MIFINIASIPKPHIVECRPPSNLQREILAMRKLQLDPEQLRVESFDTGDGTPGRGTVHGYGTPRCDAGSNTCDSVNFTCDDANTCLGDTCNNHMNTCLLSCGLCGTYKCTGGDGELTGDCVSGPYTCTDCAC